MINRTLNKLKVKKILATSKMKPKASVKKVKTVKKVVLDVPKVMPPFITAKDLNIETMYEVRVVDPNLKSFNIGYSNFDGHTFPDKILITKLGIYNKDYVHFTYYAPGFTNLMGVYVPNYFKFEALKTDEVKKEFDKFQLSNLHQYMYHYFHIGSDPEMFVEDDKGKVIPAFHFLGSKENPNKTWSGLKDGGTKMYWDGFQAEFETKAESCLGWHTDSVFCGIKGLYDAAKKHNPNAKLSLKTTMNIDSELLQVSAEEHVQFGCMPSYNAYDMTGLKLNGREVPFRSAGGHIHFGVGKIEHARALTMVKALDAVLGVACVSLFAKYDDPRRRSMYGLAGEYRLPPHGLEYRTLSNAWMAHPAIMNLVFDTARKALVFGDKGFMKHWVHDEAQTIETINTCNVEAARISLEKNKDIFMQIIAAAYGPGERTKEAYKAFLVGMENIIEDPSNIEKNWLVRPEDKWTEHANGAGKNWNTAYAIITKNQKVG